jgi:hypothetical protein
MLRAESMDAHPERERMTDLTCRAKQDFYTMQEAASYLTLPEHEVRRLIRLQTLPICFHADADITEASIKRPDGTIKNIDKTLHLAGTLKSFFSGQERDSFEAGVIDVLEVESQRFTYGPGHVLLKGHKLPTVEHHTGSIQPGYVVSGFVDSIEVESADWLFHVDDLAALIADQKASTDTSTTAKEVQPAQAPVSTASEAEAPDMGKPTPRKDGRDTGKREGQIQAIEKAALDLGYSDPLKIPTGGKAAIKAHCIASAFGHSEGAFRNAWREANKQGRIRLAEKDKYM